MHTCIHTSAAAGCLRGALVVRHMGRRMLLCHSCGASQQGVHVLGVHLPAMQVEAVALEESQQRLCAALQQLRGRGGQGSGYVSSSFSMSNTMTRRPLRRSCMSSVYSAHYSDCS